MEFNNATTIATWTGIIVFIIEVICKHFGIEIPHETVVMFVTGVVTFIIAVISSRNPNTLSWLGNAEEKLDAPGITSTEDITPITGDENEDDIC